MKTVPAPAWRHNATFGLLILVMAALCVRQVFLLRDATPQRLDQAARRQQMVIPLPARPGSIFARSSRRYIPLALSRQSPSCFADPFLIGDGQLDDVSIAVGEALSIDPRTIQRELIERRHGRFVWLKRRISEAEAQAIRDLDIPAVGVVHEWRREYPNKDLAATVVGFRLADGRPGGGLELTQDRQLKARNGKRVVLTDARRRAIWPLADLSGPPADGAQVFLCLDAVIQAYLQRAVAASVEEFDAKWGAGVVVDPRTGQVLGMCSAPTFDPNRFNETGPENRINRAVAMPFEPGSVFKPIIAAAAVDEGVVSYQTQIYCHDGTYYPHRGGRITDHGKRYGFLSVADGVVFSSNICLAQIGQKLGNEMLYRIARKFGFGEKTGIELPGESRGQLRPLARWDTYSTPRVPFGQEISVTTIQLAMAFSSLANGGLLLRPRLIEQITDADGSVLYRARRRVVRRVLSPGVAAQTLAVMQEVVERGTGKNCRMTDWTSFGKTGTAQIAGPGGYVDGAFVASFVGGAPVGEPRLICLISIYWPDKSKGHYGSKVAAPYVRDVLQKGLEYLGVPPDKGDQLAGGQDMPAGA